MDSELTCARDLARTIRKLFETGFAVDGRAARFIDSTFGCPTREDLSALIANPESDDAAMIFDLVITPDDPARLAVEDCLARWPGAAADVQAVAGLLPDSISTTLVFSDDRGEIPCSVPRPVVDRMVFRLNLSKPIDAQIRGAIKESLNKPEDRLAALAACRGSRMDLAGPAVPFVRAFIRRWPGNDMPLFFLHLRLLLHVLERPGADSDLFAALAAEQAACLQTLFRAARLEKQLARNNMETLMLQGSRGLLAADTGELKQRLNMLDAVCRAVFERPLPADTAEEPVDFSWDKTI
ncbi:MAG: hypothetical protein ACOZBW_10815 [Thermodesulfobacteriota bacterium]